MPEAQETKKTTSLTRVIAASSVGTMIEWYDFYIFGSLATIIAVKFFPKENPTAALLSTLALFAAGFVVRPFGAIFFGRLGDLIGRKYTFFVTLVLMGLSTFAIGVIPGYETLGILAPIIILVLRLLQGLALGGEYGGATTYVGEHAPTGRRGFYTSWIQTTATLGLVVSLIVIQITKSSMTDSSFNDWGWRVPFIVSIFLLVISAYIRYNMQESPMFARLKSAKKLSTNPIKESFGNKYNMKYVLLALLAATMGQGVVWYTGQFYALSFIRGQGLDLSQANDIMLIALIIGTPLFIFFGALSDKIGRKWIMIVGMLLAVLTYRPIYRAIYGIVNPAESTKVEIIAPELTSTVFEKEVSFEVKTVTDKYIDGTEIVRSTKTNMTTLASTSSKNVILGKSSFWWMVFLIFIQVVYVTMVYGPIAAFLLELFPTKIRYTSMSLPYHVGNGIFGGLVPFISTALVVSGQAAGRSEAYLEGLWYPIGVAAVCLVIAVLYLNKKTIRHTVD